MYKLENVAGTRKLTESRPHNWKIIYLGIATLVVCIIAKILVFKSLHNTVSSINIALGQGIENSVVRTTFKKKSDGPLRTSL